MDFQLNREIRCPQCKGELDGIRECSLLLEKYENRIRELRMRLEEAQEAIKAIQSDSVDAIVIKDPHEMKVYPYHNVDESYRILIQEMNGGAVIISGDGLILFANNSFAQMVKMSLEAVIGSSIYKYISHEDHRGFKTLFTLSTEEKKRIELELDTGDGTSIPVYISCSISSADNLKDYYFLVVTDLTEQKQREAITKSEKLARSIMEQANEVIVVCDGKGRIIRINHKANTLCNTSPVGQLFEDAFPCYLSDGKKFSLSQSTKPRHNQEVSLHCNGRRVNLLINAGPLQVDGNQPLGSVITLTDITDLKKLTVDLAKEKMLFKTTLRSVGDGVISCDTKGNVLFMNRAAEELTGWTEELGKGKNIEEVFNKVKDGNLTNSIDSDDHILLISKNGVSRSIEYTASPIVHENGNTIGSVLVFRDITEKRHKQEEIEYLSYFDHLTGLYNRRFYEEELRRLDVPRNLPMTLIMMDLNGLKLINDAFGHPVGDKFLQKTAKIIKGACRADDIIARVGGDEFIILLPKTGEQGAVKIIERIDGAISKEKFDNIIFSVSVGYAVKTIKTEPMEEIYKKAEDNMYRNKLSESSSMRGKNITLILNSLFEKSNRVMLHSRRVSEICELIAVAMNLDRDVINHTKTAGLMHDIGKIGISDEILNHHGRLNQDQWLEIKRHPEIGYRILSSSHEFSEISNFILEHHERWDGKGYPKGIKGERISMEARIIAIGDAYDAMTSNRLYRDTLTEKEAASEIKRCSGTQFDARIARVFIEKVLHREWDTL